MSAQKQVAIIVPMYRDTLSRFEEIALEQCQKVFAGYDRIIVKPQHLDVSALSEKYNFTETVSFADGYFADIKGYNRLMLATEFYAHFLDYDYILIYQLD